MKNINTQVTNLGVAHKIDGEVIDITDSAMQVETRKKIERKYEDNRIVNEAKALIRAKMPASQIYAYIHGHVLGSHLT